MKYALRLMLLVLSIVLVVSGTAFADAVFTQSNSPDVLCSAGSPCGSIIVSQGAGLFVGDLVVTVALEGEAENFQLDHFGFDSGLSLKLECFAFGDSICIDGQTGDASLKTHKQFGPFGKFDYDLLTGLSGGKGCCKNTFTFVVSQSDNEPLTLDDIDNVFAGRAANKRASGFVYAERVTPEPSTLLLLGSVLTGIAVGIRRRTRA